ncbi:glycosyl hydrolase [Tricladium varicosporioides]|nr:glycosyl hydrolase [Hymenoscyphus varicosporioides]
MFFSIFSAALILSGVASSSPLGKLRERATSISPVISTNFPDPAIFKDFDGTWYALATNNNPGPNVQIAKAPTPSGPWTILSNDLLPKPGKWSTGANVWAPDLQKIGSQYVLYYSATSTLQTSKHCVGAATSTTVLGPYAAIDTPIACPLNTGGAIDPAGFTDVDGTNYVVYKVDGNSIGHGGVCGNTVGPIVPTPIMLQELAKDGFTPVGSPVRILDRSDADGPLIEAPQIILIKGVYFLFFSSNCFSTPQYDVSYATAASIKGPYTKSSRPLMVTNDPFALTAPGGAQASCAGDSIVFHANCDAGRCMYERAITISGKNVSIS